MLNYGGTVTKQSRVASIQLNTNSIFKLSTLPSFSLFLQLVIDLSKKSFILLICHINSLLSVEDGYMGTPTIKSLFALFLVIYFTSFETMAAVVPTALTASTPIPGCAKSMTELGLPSYNGSYTFNNFNSTALTAGNPGQLCPGTYSIYAYCYTYFGGGCGGSSCGWSITIGATLVSGAGGTTLSTSSGHGGGSTTHGNPSENQYVPMWANGTYDTANAYNIFISTYQEPGNNISWCTLYANYTGSK
jgi:hypothetical protein